MRKYLVSYRLESAWEEWLVEADSKEALLEDVTDVTFLELIDHSNDGMTIESAQEYNP